MHKRIWAGLALCSAMGAMAQQGSRSMPPPTIDVAVLDGRIAVATNMLRTGSGQVTLSWRLVTPGYRFTSDSIDFGEAAGYFSCSTVNSGQGIRCVKSADTPSGRMRYLVAVSSVGAGDVLESEPNLWIQNE